MIGVRELLAFSGALVGGATGLLLGLRHGWLLAIGGLPLGFIAGLAAGYLYAELVLDALGDYAVGLLKRNRLVGSAAVALWMITVFGLFLAPICGIFWLLKDSLRASNL